MKICAVCGTECEDKMKFCLNCGNPFPISSEVVIPEEKPKEAAKAPEKEAAPDMTADEAVASEEMAAKEEPAEITKIEAPAEEIEEEKEQAAEPDGAAVEAAVAAQAEATEKAVIKENKKDLPEEDEPSEDKPEKKGIKGFFFGRKDDDDDDDDDEDFDGEGYDDYEDEDEDISSKKMSAVAVISLIFAIIGVISCGFGCILSFSNLLYAALFFVPALIGAITGIVGLMTSGKHTPYRGRPLALTGMVISLIAIILWIVCIFFLKNQASDMMSVISLIVKS